MKRVIIASHHNMSEGLSETLRFIMNHSQVSEDIIVVNAYVDEKETDITDRVAKLFDTFANDDEVLILTDMMGGSVTQKFIPYLNDNVHMIAGVNLPLALGLLLTIESDLTAENIIFNIEEAKKQIVYVNQLKMDVSADDE